MRSGLMTRTRAAARLDREQDAVETPTIRVTAVALSSVTRKSACPACPLVEEPTRIAAQHSVHRRIRLRRRQRGHSPHPLTVDADGLPARDEETHAGGVLQHEAAEPCARVEQMLGVVDQDHQITVGDEGAQGGEWISSDVGSPTQGRKRDHRHQ